MKQSPDEIAENLDRRDFLKGAGVVGGAAGALGLVWYNTRRDDESPEPEPPEQDPPEEDPPEEDPPEEDPPEEEPPEEDPPEDDQPEAEIPYAEEFETVVRAVDAGADPEGEEPVNHLFREHSGSDTLFAFDPGTYRFDPFQISNRRIGIVGIDDENPRFVPTEGNCRGGNPYYFFEDVSDLVLDSIDFDFQDDDAGGPLHLFLEGDSTITDVSYLGTCGNQFGIARIEVHDPEGSAHVENFEATNVAGDNSLTGVYVSSAHAGELTFEDCHLGEFSDNGLYASSPGGPNGRDGRVNVVGGTYRNNNIANVRLGSTGSIAERVSVLVDKETHGWGQLNSRGIRLRNRASQVIRDCDITFAEEAAYSFGAIVFHSANGGGTVENTEIQVDRDEIPAIKTFPPAEDPDEPPVMENVTITGTAAGGVIADIEGRDETVFRNCSIEQPGSDRDGLRFRNAHDCRIVDSTIEVGGDPVILSNASVTVENTTLVTPDGERTISEESFEDERLSVDGNAS